MRNAAREEKRDRGEERGRWEEVGKRKKNQRREDEGEGKGEVGIQSGMKTEGGGKGLLSLEG